MLDGRGMIYGANSFCPAQWLNNALLEVQGDEIRNHRRIEGKAGTSLFAGSAGSL